ncbi:isopenicillin N synthase family oxygenase [Streptomyces sp. NBC_01306]|uniref:isopenicillin N synthase family dioxygenase n=1 Tax=Streptomyces sp. NBC_01306 TaxID=2903819 RepID=UPI00225931EF|nr:2-oxoglutarate and iron-dependent oxygenase domain-containing protein [Streptomyces sp. NBC_01306]MCX4728867.1 isopenicillin N synthase family oxygenase [Streptomyces sp. NBC_01306]
MSTSIPTVDITQWRHAGVAGKAEITSVLDAALRSTGAFLMRGHGVPRRLMTELRAQARAFFDLPRSVKSQYGIRAAYDSGWLEMHPAGGVGVEHSPGDGPDVDAPDLHESFYLGPGPGQGQGASALDRLYYPANRWPGELPSLKAAADAYTAHMVRLAEEINALLAAVLGLPGDFFTSRARHSTWTQNLSWYPSLNAVGGVADGQLRNGPHTDLGTFTLLSRQQGVGGLQAWNEAEGWFAPPYDPDAFLVNLGDLMELWTDGRWRALRHRVLGPSAQAPDEELTSLVFFYESDPETLVEPLAPPAGGGAGRGSVVSRHAILEKLGARADLLSAAG